ncbi:hypothetical protein BDFB_013603 [Asbolus verrucosus]|uniref:Uncharacterized protein n=1 Tax=Asbolus verrucosus TaxID=1661398 RepID=A0A482VC71_ASBVE|nr:hypothetical protein BDFB_013603 [Asbolus verrucosus]
MREIAKQVKENLLPEKSRNLYMKAYITFTNWCSSKNINFISENVPLTYFQDYAADKKASTLWAHYSMLKSTTSLKENIDVKVLQIDRILKASKCKLQTQKVVSFYTR